MNIAASIQKATEDILLKILLSLKKEYKEDNLCMAGGVALNCVANGLIKKIFQRNLDSTCSWRRWRCIRCYISFLAHAFKKKENY